MRTKSCASRIDAFSLWVIFFASLFGFGSQTKTLSSSIEILGVISQKYRRINKPKAMLCLEIYECHGINRNHDDKVTYIYYIFGGTMANQTEKNTQKRKAGLISLSEV